MSLVSPARNLWRVRGAKTYAESLDIIHGELVAKEMEEGILKHAAVTVAMKGGGQGNARKKTAGENQDCTYDRTKRSRLSHLGFCGLNLMNLLKSTWATGAMPLWKDIN